MIRSLSLILALVFAVTRLGLAHPAQNRGLIKITTESPDGVLIDHVDPDREGVTLAGPDVEIELGQERVTFNDLTSTSVSGRLDKRNDSVTFRGDYEIKVSENGEVITRGIARKAEIVYFPAENG